MSPDKVLRGERGWYFLTNDANAAIDQHIGARYLSAADLESMMHLWFARKAIFSYLRIPFAVLFAPDKESVYAEFLPVAIREKLATHRPVHRVCEALSRFEIPHLYPLDLFSELKVLGDLYYRGDTHWASFAASKSLEHALSIADSNYTLPSLPEVSIIPEKKSHESRSGDLGSKIGLTILETYVSAKLSANHAIRTVSNSYENRGHIEIFENRQSEFGTVLILGDSFAHGFLPYAAELFSRLIFVHSAVLDYRLLTEIKPDFVLFEQVERFLIKVPNDQSGIDLSKSAKGNFLVDISLMDIYNELPSRLLNKSNSISINLLSNDIYEFCKLVNFYPAEPENRWTGGESSEIIFDNLPNCESVTCIIDIQPFVDPSWKVARSLEIRASGDSVYSKFVSQREVVSFDVRIRDRQLRLCFDHAGSMSPAQLGMSGDKRSLGMNIRGVTLRFSR